MHIITPDPMHVHCRVHVPILVHSIEEPCICSTMGAIGKISFAMNYSVQKNGVFQVLFAR